MTDEAKGVFKRVDTTLKDNQEGKTICFISRGSWADPQIAYEGYLLNYVDVYELACPEDAPEDYEPDENEWLCGCMDSLFGYTDCGMEPARFSGGDVFSVTNIIPIKP